MTSRDESESSQAPLPNAGVEQIEVAVDDVIPGGDIAGQTQSPPNNPHHESNENYDRNPSVDDIGVTLDYEPSGVLDTYNDTPSISEEFRRTSQNVEQTESNIRSNRRRRTAQRRQDIGLVSFFTKHWFGQCTAGFLIGLACLTIGIVFVVTDLPSYIGVLFTLVSISPFYMAFSIFRRSRRLEAQSREDANQRNAIRRHHQEEENRLHRRGYLPYSEYPPCYDNLGFDSVPIGLENPETESRRSSSSGSSHISPPAYDETWKVEESVKETSME